MEIRGAGCGQRRQRPYLGFFTIGESGNRRTFCDLRPRAGRGRARQVHGHVLQSPARDAVPGAGRRPAAADEATHSAGTTASGTRGERKSKQSRRTSPGEPEEVILAPKITRL